MDMSHFDFNLYMYGYKYTHTHTHIGSMFVVSNHCLLPAHLYVLMCILIVHTVVPLRNRSVYVCDSCSK